MKKYFYLLVTALTLTFSAKAIPGDTTWVQANTNDSLSWYGNYDAVTVFPHAGATTYRKIIMYFTLGKYMCPAGSTWCGDWDYTVLNYLITPGGQAYELSRLITPYANAAAPRTPWEWQQPYIYDVTDYVSLLHDTATVRILYSGYSGGFLANIKFAFIEGTPDRNVLGLTRLWNGSFTYGDTVGADINDINTHFTNTYNTAPAGTQTTDLKFTVTGHGSDNNYCNEFCSHNYQVILDGRSVATETIWRDNCGVNELYPQSGTWLYQRANWCPGAMVYPHYDTLPGVTPGSSFNLSLLFDEYAGNGGASYTTEAQLFYYGPMNKSLDADIYDIIAPTNDPNHFRENPIAGTPIISVENSGSATINSIQIQYGVAGGTPLTYTWTGTLMSLQTTQITLPGLPDLFNNAGVSGTNTFTAKILQVNGVTDDDTTNNTMTSTYVNAPVWPSSFRVVIHPGNEAYPTGTDTSEKSWQIFDMYNNIVASRQPLVSTTFTDTVTLFAGIYKFQVIDSSCDGLSWWVWVDNPGYGVTVGYLQVTNMSGVLIPMNGYYYSGTYSGDFGCVYDQYFAVSGPLAIQNVNETALSINAFPNPAKNEVNLSITGTQQVNGTLQIIDALGRVVSVQTCNSAEMNLDVAPLANGVYTILYIDDKNPDNRLQTRLIICK